MGCINQLQSRLQSINRADMPWWYFEKDDLRQTVSRRDGVDFDTEKRYRR